MQVKCYIYNKKKLHENKCLEKEPKTSFSQNIFHVNSCSKYKSFVSYNQFQT